jgi:hypothetical protein
MKCFVALVVDIGVVAVEVGDLAVVAVVPQEVMRP